MVAPGLTANRLGSTLAKAALLGVIAYGIYDLTNLATLEGWPLSVTVVDMVWGVVLSVIVAFVGLTVNPGCAEGRTLFATLEPPLPRVERRIVPMVGTTAAVRRAAL